MMTRRTVLAAAATSAAGLAARPAEALAPLSVVELRQYRTRPGGRDTLIDLFETEFVEPQEAVGVRVIGTFRDLDDPDRFIWLRGFSDARTRREALETFYDGPAWRRHREVANAQIADSDDVLQLAPTRPFDLDGLARAPVGTAGAGRGLVTATLCPIRPGDVATVAEIFARDIAPALAAAGAPVIGAYATDPGPNSFPRLPVRQDVCVFVWFQAFVDAAAQAHFAGGPAPAFLRVLADRLTGPVEVLRLAPTARSLIQGPSPARDGRADFDFLIGSWRVKHRRLKRRLAGSTDWASFDGWCQCRKTMGGLGNMDDNILNLPDGAYGACGVRRFDPALNRWSIWWLDARFPNIEPRVHGGFRDGVGTFIGEDVFEGRPILVRFTWSKITTDSAHWSQAFSTDGGQSWEINWDMDFERVG